MYSLGVKPFLQYHSQGHLSRSRSNIKVTVFAKLAVAGAFVFHKHMLYKEDFENNMGNG